MTAAVIGALRGEVTLATASLETSASKAMRVFEALKGTMSSTATASERAGARFSSGFKKGLEPAAQSAALFATEMDRLQSKFDPLFAASRRYETELNDLNRAQQLGVVTGARYEAALQEINQRYLGLGQGAVSAAGHVQALNTQSRALGASSANIASQFQDIWVQFAAGTAPLTVALQQGTQISGVFTQMGANIRSVGPILLGAFQALLSPMSLVTIGVIALGGAMVQWFSAGKEETLKFKDALSAVDASLGKLRETAAIFTAEGIQGLINKYGELNAEVLRFIEAQRQATMDKAINDATQAVKALRDEFGFADTKVDDFSTAARMRFGNIAKDLGLTSQQVRELAAEFNKARSAESFAEMQQSLARIREIMGESTQKTSEWYFKLLDAEDALRQLNVEGGKASGWLGTAISGAETLASKLWNAVRAGAALRDAQFADKVGPDERGSQRLQEFSAGDYRRNKAAEAAIDKGGSGGSNAALKEENELLRESEALKKRIASATDKYQDEVKKLNLMLKKGLIDQKQYDLAVQELNKTLVEGAPLIGDIADAWGDFVASGFRDFDGFAKSVASSFRKLIADMVSTAVKNRIVLSVGVSTSGGGGIAGAVGGSGGLLGGGGGLLGGGGFIGKWLGGFGTAGGGIFGGLAGGTGLLGGLGNALSGGLGGLFNIGANAAAAGGGLLAGIGAALPILGIGAAIFSFFKTKKKLLDAGVMGTLSLGGTEAFDFQKIQKSKFWGLSKKTSVKKTVNDALAEMLGETVAEAAKSVTDLGASIGTSADLSKISTSFQVSTKGLSNEQIQQALLDQVAAFADEMAKAMLGGAAWKDLAKDGETATQTLTRLSQSLATVNLASEALGWNLFAISKQGASAASAFADLLGGIEGFKEITDSYYANFYTAQERTDFTTKKLTESLAALGLSMPASRDQFRAMVDQAEAAGNTTLVAELLKLAPAFATISQSADDLANTLQNELKKQLDALNANDYASLLDFRRAQAAIAYGGGLMVAGSTDPAIAAAATSASGALGGTQSAASAMADRMDGLVTQIATHVEALRRYVTRWDIDGMPPVRPAT